VKANIQQDKKKEQIIVKPGDVLSINNVDVKPILKHHNGQPGSGTRIRVRGVGTINNSNPLYVVDGFQTGNINFLMPGDIESIEILKDASAVLLADFGTYFF